MNKENKATMTAWTLAWALKDMTTCNLVPGTYATRKEARESKYPGEKIVKVLISEL